MVKAAPPMATIVIDPQIKSGQARNDADVLKQQKQDLRHLSGERSLQKKLRKGSTPHLSTKRSSSEDNEGDDPSNSGRKGKAKSSSGGQKVSRPRSKSSQDRMEPAGEEETWPRSKKQEQPTRKSACGTGAPQNSKVAKAPTKTDNDGHKMSNKKTHPTSGAELPSAPKTKQSNDAEPPRKSATYTRKVSRRESVGVTDGDKSSRPKDVDRSAAADESYRDGSKSRTKTERPKQRENRARNESSDADVAMRNGDVSRNDEAKKSPNLMKRTKSLGSSPPSSPLRNQRERLASQHALRRKSSTASAGSRNRIVSSVPESAAGGLDFQLKNSTRRKQVCRKSAVEEGPNAAKETKQESGDGKANHGSKSLRPPGEDDNVRRSRRRQDIIDNCDKKEKDPGLRRKQSAEAKPREIPRAAKVLDKPPTRDEKVVNTSKSETTRKDNSESVQSDRGRSRHADKPPKATKDSKKADNKKSRNVRIARSTSPERRGKGGAGIGAERRNINERIKRSRSVSPHGTKIPSTFSVYRNEFLEEMANMSFYPPTVVGDVARTRHRAEHTSGTPLPLKKEKNRDS